jgi:hypothetical protein
MNVMKTVEPMHFLLLMSLIFIDLWPCSGLTAPFRNKQSERKSHDRYECSPVAAGSSVN